MLSTKTNFHRHILPKIGETGYLIMKRGRYGDIEYIGDKKQLHSVIAFPLCDNVLPYSVGIHTAIFRNEATGKTVKASGFYFEAI